MFLLSLATVVYVYLGYPFALVVIRAVKGKKPPIESIGGKKRDVTPSVSLVISAHNEQEVIGKKIENSLLLDYPRDKLEIVVASDCSSDRTNEIVRSYSDQGIILNIIPQRGGKTVAQNETVPLTKGEIVIFSDADSIFERDVILRLATNFSDPEVGAVSGRLFYTNSNESAMSSGESLYWKYENLLRQLESDIGSCIMANAAIFAIRREFYRHLDPGFSEDFVLPLWISADGAKSLFDPEAVCFERTAVTPKDESSMRIRTAHGDSYGLFKLKCMLSPFRPLLAFQSISHKLLRWAVGFFLILAFISNALLLHSSPLLLYKITFLLQSAFYLAALAGLILNRKGKNMRLFYLPYYFCVVNIAVLIGLMKSILGVPYVTIWEQRLR